MRYIFATYLLHTYIFLEIFTISYFFYLQNVKIAKILIIKALKILLKKYIEHCTNEHIEKVKKK